MKIKSVIQIHPLLLCLLLVSYLFGLFVEMICLFLLIFIHECGHLIAARYFGWEIKRLVIWPFGGVMETEDFYNRPTKEELIVTLAGPLQHIWVFGVIELLTYTTFPTVYLDQLFWLNTMLLLFNILPILPLDGGRFLFLCIGHWLPFYRSLLVTSIFSLVVIPITNGILFINGWVSPPLLILSIILWFDNWFTYRNLHLLLMKHMLARYMHHPVDRNNIHFLYVSAHTTFQEMMKQFRKNRYHMIQINRQSVLTEDDYLQLLFSRQPR